LKNHLEIIKKCSLFSKIGESELQRMLTCLDARIVAYDKKQTIFAEGIPAKHIGVLLSGAVQMTQTDYYGNRSILINVAPGEVFAEAFACAEVPSMPVTAVADAPCEVMLIECAHILHTCENNCGFHQQLIYNLMKDLASKTVLFLQRIEITSKRTTREKLMTYLAMQAKKAGKNEFTIPFDRQELADYLEVDRSGLSAEISKLQREGLLISQKNRFVLL
jgi:CRP-like cAMP-binding protein